jgi:hypothetical protein
LALSLPPSRLLPVGNQPTTARFGAYDTFLRPDIGPEGPRRFQLSLLFPQ